MQGGFVLHPATPTYSTCGCFGDSQETFCDALSPAESLNTPERRNDRFTNTSNNIVQACSSNFNYTCVQDYDNSYSWAVDNCVSNDPIVCSCVEGVADCRQLVGSVTEDTPTGGVSATLWYNNQVSRLDHMTVM